MVEEAQPPHSGKTKKGQRAGVPPPLPRHAPSDLKLPAGPHRLKVPQPVNGTKLGTKPLTHGHSSLLLILPSRLDC